VSKDDKKQNVILEKLKSSYKALLFPIISILLAIIAAIFFVMWAKNAGFIESGASLFKAVWKGSFGSKFSITETLTYTTPLIFTGLANAIAFRTGLFNIGVEGQLQVGMIAAASVGLIPGIPHILHIILVLAFGALAGAIWGAIPGYLKARTGTNEVVNTIMMNYIALYLSNYVVMGPLNLKGQSSTPLIKQSAMLSHFMGASFRVNTGLFIALAFVVLIYFLLWKTTVGYELRAVGLSSMAAEYGGISIKKNIILAMVISGAMAGLGGAAHIAGVQRQAISLPNLSGMGFDGMAVALLAKSHPIGVVFAAVLFGALQSSALTLQMARIPKEIIALMQSIIIIFVAADYVYKWIGEKRKKKEALEK
jgi:general nucleoside transport system permease protein